MISDANLEALSEAGIIVDDIQGSKFDLSQSTKNKLQELRNNMEDENTDTKGQQENDPVRQFLNEYPKLTSIYELLQPVTNLSTPEKIHSIILIDVLDHTVERTPNDPDAFLPIMGENLQRIVSYFPKSVVYVWKYDCEPCEIMRKEFNSILSNSENDLAMFSTYGPDFEDELREQFNVVGAPTTLFLVDGMVDARLQGPYHTETIENEIQTLKEIE